MGVSTPNAETFPPALGEPLKKSFCPTTISAETGAGLLSTAALNRRIRWFPVSATQRLPVESTATARGWFIDVVDTACAVRVVKLDWPKTASGSMRVRLSNGERNRT